MSDWLVIEELDVGRPRHVLDRLVEELVVRCTHDETARTVTLIARSHWHAVGDDGAFLRFVFAGARDVATLYRDGTIARGIDLRRNKPSVIAGTFVPEGLALRALGIGLYGGHVSGIRFRYESVRAEVRHARHERHGTDTRWFDRASGREDRLRRSIRATLTRLVVRRSQRGAAGTLSSALVQRR